MSIQSSLKRRLFASLVATGICFATTANAGGADCGCNAGCQSCPPVHSSCDCGCSSPRRSLKECFVFKSLDAVAGGVEKLLGLDKCHRGCDELNCDDACDAAMIDDLMMPLPADAHDVHWGPNHSSPMYLDHGARSTPPPQIHHYHSEPVQIAPVGPHKWHGDEQPVTAPRDTQLRITSPQLSKSKPQGQHLGSGILVEPKMDAIDPPVRIREFEPSAPKAEPQSERGSIFDSLSNPFEDDDASVQGPQLVRPSNYEPDLRPISKRQLSSSYGTSSRRDKSVR